MGARSPTGSYGGHQPEHGIHNAHRSAADRNSKSPRRLNACTGGGKQDGDSQVIAEVTDTDSLKQLWASTNFGQAYTEMPQSVVDMGDPTDLLNSAVTVLQLQVSPKITQTGDTLVAVTVDL